MSEASLVERYGWKEACAPHSCGYLIPEVLQIIDRLEPGRVLDLGSGNGALCGALKSRGYDVVGVEHDKHGVAIARSAHPEIRFYNLDVQDDPAALLAAEGKFDLVVSTEVIEHLFSPHRLPIFAGHALRPGGFLVVSTPYHGYLKNLALALTNKWDAHLGPLWHGGHIKFWSRRTLSQLLAQNGFEVVRFRGVGRLPGLWKSMILVCRKLAGASE